MSQFLNVGCGSKFHPAWENVDVAPRDPMVKKCDVTKGLMYPDSTFSAVYHSQVLEHLAPDDARPFMLDCVRVLRRGGVLRVVVPDLENIAREYLSRLENVMNDVSPVVEAKYDWIVIELLDQLARNSPGGQMAKFLGQSGGKIRDYIIQRTGVAGEDALEYWRNGSSRSPTLKDRLRRLGSRMAERLGSNRCRVGTFRLGGEAHLWMYDRFSLKRLFRSVGLADVRICSPFESDIPRWDQIGLDAVGGKTIDPSSLIMEATKY